MPPPDDSTESRCSECGSNAVHYTLLKRTISAVWKCTAGELRIGAADRGVREPLVMIYRHRRRGEYAYDHAKTEGSGGR